MLLLNSSKKPTNHDEERKRKKEKNKKLNFVTLVMAWLIATRSANHNAATDVNPFFNSLKEEIFQILLFM